MRIIRGLLFCTFRHQAAVVAQWTKGLAVGGNNSRNKPPRRWLLLFALPITDMSLSTLLRFIFTSLWQLSEAVIMVSHVPNLSLPPLNLLRLRTISASIKTFRCLSGALWYLSFQTMVMTKYDSAFCFLAARWLAAAVVWWLHCHKQTYTHNDDESSRRSFWRFLLQTGSKQTKFWVQFLILAVCTCN